MIDLEVRGVVHEGVVGVERLEMNIVELILDLQMQSAKCQRATMNLPYLVRNNNIDFLAHEAANTIESYIFE